MLLHRNIQFLRSPEVEGGAAPAPEAGAGATTDAAAAPAVVEASTETHAPEPAKTEPAAQETKSEPTLLESAVGKDDKSEPKEPAPAEAKKDEGETKPDASKAEEAEPEKKEAGADEPPPPAPKQYDPASWKFPEGTAPDAEKMKAFETIVGTSQMPQEAAQSLLDQHIAEVNRVQKEATDNQHSVWRELQDKWKTEFRKDPELGGNREQTTLSTAKAVIEQYGGTREQQAELFSHLNRNGMGNFLPFIRLLNNIGKQTSVFEDGIVGAAAPAPAGQDRGTRWYGNSNGKGAGA